MQEEMQEIPVAGDLQVGWKLAFALKRFLCLNVFTFYFAWFAQTKLNFIKLLHILLTTAAAASANYSLFKTDTSG
jgi:hypothetical protein